VQASAQRESTGRDSCSFGASKSGRSMGGRGCFTESKTDDAWTRHLRTASPRPGSFRLAEALLGVGFRNVQQQAPVLESLCRPP